MKYLLICLLLMVGCSKPEVPEHCGSYAILTDLQTKEVLGVYDNVNDYEMTDDPIITLYRPYIQGLFIRRKVVAQISTGDRVVSVRLKKGKAPE